MTSEQPRISIVVPAYNVSRFIEATIRSVQAQTEQRWECVIVDDGSADDTLSVATELTIRDSRFCVISQANAGAAAARNTGFRALSPSSRWVTFMDSDDVWRPHALMSLLACAEAGSGIGCHGLAEFIDADGRPVDVGSYSARGRRRLALRGRALVVLPLREPTDFDVLINGNVLFPPGLVLARRDAYEAVGPFDETFNGPEDWDMLIRLSRVGPLNLIDEVLLDYRHHDSNLGAHPSVPRQAWLVRCVNFWSPENTPQQRQKARRGWRAYQRRLRREHLRVLRSSLASEQTRSGAQALLGVVVCSLREARGFPLPRVIREPLRW